jgi:hypothetical protein
VSKCLLQQLYATTSRLPLYELLENLTWIPSPNSSDVLPLRAALHQDVLDADDVVEILDYLVDRDRTLDGSLPALNAACRRDASFHLIALCAGVAHVVFLSSTLVVV